MAVLVFPKSSFYLQFCPSFIISTTEFHSSDTRGSTVAFMSSDVSTPEGDETEKLNALFSNRTLTPELEQIMAEIGGANSQF